MDLAKLKESLIEKQYNPAKVSKFIAYIADDLTKINGSAAKHTQQELYNLFVKYYNAGTNLDGINVVLTGKNMGLITYHGFMNKVKQAYKNVFFDVQLVREGDEFNFGKESGSVVYSHTIKNPFENGKIIGAYCVVKLNNESGDESLELLNARDYQEMKNSSRNSRVWEKWESEFWRKSVIKRACKVYFSEEIEELERIDNDDYGLANVDGSDETKNEILKSHGKEPTK